MAEFCSARSNIISPLQWTSLSPPLTGMIGAMGTVLDWHKGKGHIRTHGEVWAAIGTEKLNKGTQVWVKARNGLVLEVDSRPPDGERK